MIFVAVACGCCKVACIKATYSHYKLLTQYQQQPQQQQTTNECQTDEPADSDGQLDIKSVKQMATGDILADDAACGWNYFASAFVKADEAVMFGEYVHV